MGGTLSGSFTLTFTCNSTTFVKKFSWAKAVTDSPKIFHATYVPGTTAAVDGSTWFQHDGVIGGGIIGQWTRDNGTWVPTTIEGAVLANIDAGDISTGYLSAARIDANTISASQIVASEGLWTKVLGAHLIQATEIGADQINAGHIAAGSIEADMLNVQHTDGGTGQKMTLTPDGLRLWGNDDGGEPSISLTTSSAQALSILDSNDARLQVWMLMETLLVRNLLRTSN